MKDFNFGKIIFSIITFVLLFGFTTTTFAQPTVSGDLRLRHEILNPEDGATENVNRVRARIRLNGDLNDTMNYGIGLTTGNRRLSGTTNEHIAVDLAYIGWDVSDNFTVIGGKINNPLYRVGDNELLWNDEFNPEGGAVQIDMDIFGKGGQIITPTTSLFINGGYFVLNERPTEEDFALIGGQAGIVIGDNLTIGAGHYYYTLIEYSFYEYFGEMGIDLAGLPVTLYGNYVTDNDLESWIAGAKAAPGIFELSYNYRDVDYRMVNYNFSDPDYTTFVGYDGGEGHEIGLGVDLMTNVTAQATYFTDRDFDEYKAQVDFIVNF